jgi:ATP:ADP antiporter, AAA family
MASETHGEFGSVRRFLWPIHRYELKKFLPLFFMGFLLSLNYFILKTLKDTLIINAKGSGAEVIPFVKVWGILPGAILITFLYTRLSNNMQRERVFYCIIGGLLAFFTLFTFYIYPNRASVHPVEFCDWLETVMPSALSGLHGLITMLRYWTFTVFYVCAELWGSFGMSVLFWGFSNEISDVDEAKRFYGPLGMGTNFAGIVAGYISVSLCRGVYYEGLPFGATAWEQSLIMLTAVVLVAGLGIMAIYRFVNTNVLTDPKLFHPEHMEEDKKAKKKKISLTESLKHLIEYRYLLYIATLVLCFNISNNLVEVMWKKELKLMLNGDHSAFNVYTSQVQMIMGLIATLSSMLVTGNVIRRFGWTKSAMVTPFVVLITSAAFFAFFFMKGRVETIHLVYWTLTPLTVVATFGSLHQVLTRTCRYTLFDSTKEISFTPLHIDSKVKGKAAIDGVGTRLGKSAGSLMMQMLLLVFGSLSASAPYMAGIILVICGFWMNSVLKLGKEFHKLTDTKKKPEDKDSVASENLEAVKVGKAVSDQKAG